MFVAPDPAKKKTRPGGDRDRKAFLEKERNSLFSLGKESKTCKVVRVLCV